MRLLHTLLIMCRNLYILVMFLPLWIWSAAYRYSFLDSSWLKTSWTAFSILALFYGAFGLWFFAERAVVAHYSGKPSRGLTISVWAIASTLFLTCLGAALDQGTQGWGRALFLVGTDALPLILLFCIEVYSYETKKAKEGQQEKRLDQRGMEQTS